MSVQRGRREYDAVDRLPKLIIHSGSLEELRSQADMSLKRTPAKTIGGQRAPTMSDHQAHIRARRSCQSMGMRNQNGGPY